MCANVTLASLVKWKHMCTLIQINYVWLFSLLMYKALGSIQLCTGKYILGCSITTCDEPVHADLGLETLKK